jgi:hypothetical protein
VNGLSAEHFQPLDFIWAKALGTNTTATCEACRNCKECKFRSDSISFRENREYEVIISGLQLDVDKKKWTASFCVSPWTLMDNYHQARKCMETQEQWLIKFGSWKSSTASFTTPRSKESSGA